MYGPVVISLSKPEVSAPRTINGAATAGIWMHRSGAVSEPADIQAVIGHTTQRATALRTTSATAMAGTWTCRWRNRESPAVIRAVTGRIAPKVTARFIITGNTSCTQTWMRQSGRIAGKANRLRCACGLTAISCAGTRVSVRFMNDAVAKTGRWMVQPITMRAAAGSLIKAIERHVVEEKLSVSTE